MQTYKMALELLEWYFKSNHYLHWKKLFLEGGCYWFANFINSRVEGSYIVINRVVEHCAVCIGGKVYDITGEINKGGYTEASVIDIAYMKKNYKPKFNVYELEEWISLMWGFQKVC